MSTAHIHSAGASRKFLLFAVLLVLLTFPHASEEFIFKFAGDGDNADDASKQVTKRRVTPKYKFRKIERVYVDKTNRDSANDDDADDDNDDDDDDIRRVAAASSRTNEDEEFQFERARKAHKDRGGKQITKDKTKDKGQKIVKKHYDDDDEDEDDNNNRKKKKMKLTDESESFFSSIYNSFFGETKKKDKKRHDDSDEDKSAEDTSNTNGIIDWLKWLGEKLGRSKPPEPVVPAADSWLSYLNRWPFNSLFPIGQPQKPIRMPRHGSATRRAASKDDDDDDSAEKAPMSQKHFESLLHTLPGFVVNASHVADSECQRQMQIFHRQLRGNKLWTLQMLDATGKISSGLLRGNINQFGDFELCTQVKTVVKLSADNLMRIRGKYCLAHIETQTDIAELKVPVHLAHGRGLWNSHLGNPSHFVPRYAVANWGVCIPHMCPGEVVQQMIETNLRPYNKTGVEFHVEVDDNDCYVPQTKSFLRLIRKDGKFGASILYILTLSLLTLTSFLYEHWGIIKEFIQNRLKSAKSETDTTDKASEEEGTETKSIEPEENGEATNITISEEADETQAEVSAEETENIESAEHTSFKYLTQEIFKSFSPRYTLSQLLSQERLDVQFPIFHVLKLGATFMLYICLKYLMIGHLPIMNRDNLVRVVDQPFSVVFRTPMLYTDILLLISGFLSAYQLSEEMESKSHIQLLKRMTAKIARYLPTVYVVLLFQTWVLPHLGSGPLWTNLIGQNTRLCEQQMWRNAFSVQNAIDFEETCSPLTIQIALEVQLYLLGPLIVWLYHTDADAGFFVYGAIQAMSVALRYARTNREHLSMTLFHGMNVSKFYRTANLLYASPIIRATPYLLGIGAGLLHRSQEGSLQVSAEIVPIGWILTVLSIFWCFWSPSAGMRSDFIYTSAEAASFASWSPLILGLALCWIIFMFPKQNSVLGFLTSSRPILFLSRISFPMQLSMYIVVLYNTASVKDAIKYHMTDLINFNEIGTILVFATLLAFLIDVPSQNVRRLLVNRLFIERPKEQEIEPSSGTEQSEADLSEDRSEHEKTTCDTPEPPDTIWASDPEEEEQKYITRRRSSTINVQEETAEEKAPTVKESAQVEKKAEEAEEEEADEEEDEADIAEEDEVKKRPPTPPIKEEKKEEPKPTFTRRRRPTSDD